ncbi:MAG TPA: cell division protein ZapE [Frankiaceae bacterium]|nr:cell division protein ZapE [Frankiaceae bacterium]
MPERLSDRTPEVPADALVAAMVPPPRFDSVRFETYRPDPDEPSQRAALATMQAFAERVAAADGGRTRAGRSLLGRRRKRTGSGGKPGLYLDGGFGVGKTHLLASLWHASPGPKAYGTFVELTSLVGALGFAATVEALSGFRLLAVDEFELDDPGDTVLVSSLLDQLVAAGVFLATTSNTQPEDLGQQRFAADDFLREIQGLAQQFDVRRIEGQDYRHRGRPEAPAPPTDEQVAQRVAAVDGATCDTFVELCDHLATLHPSRYGRLVANVPLVGIAQLRPVTDQAVALRLGVLIDRLYDRKVPIVASGAPVAELFGEELLHGPHRKKYQRAVSRLGALMREGAEI